MYARATWYENWKIRRLAETIFGKPNKEGAEE